MCVRDVTVQRVHEPIWYVQPLFHEWQNFCMSCCFIIVSIAYSITCFRLHVYETRADEAKSFLEDEKSARVEAERRLNENNIAVAGPETNNVFQLQLQVMNMKHTVSQLETVVSEKNSIIDESKIKLAEGDQLCQQLSNLKATNQALASQVSTTYHCNSNV